MRIPSGKAWGAGTALVAGALAWTAPAQQAHATDAAKQPKSEIVELGRRLFMDPAASRLGKNSCASCHDPEHGFSDARERSADDRGPTKRHSQTLIDLRGKGFHWDGEFDTVRQLLVARCASAEEASEQTQRLRDERRQAARAAGLLRPQTGSCAGMEPADGYGPPVTPDDVEATFKAPLSVPERLAQDGLYAEAFRAAFGSPRITQDRVLDAMDAYVRSIRSETNAFDRFVAGDRAALSAPAKRGLALFEGKAGCAQCHLTSSTAARPLLTDGKFHTTGVAFRGLAANAGGQRPLDRGRAGISFDGRQTGAFKTPTLRDVAVRAPYMHDGSMKTLAEVVDYYDAGGAPGNGLDPAVRKLSLSRDEKADLVSFLESLTGATRPALGTREDAECEVRVVDPAGAPVAGMEIDVEPFGDRVAGAAASSARVVTDASGVARFLFPAATHARLEGAGWMIGDGRPVPDTARSITLIATRRDTVSLRISRTSPKVKLPPTVDAADLCTNERLFTLRKVRQISADEAIYTSAVPASLAGAGTQRLGLRVDDDGLLPHELNLGGGASPELRLTAGAK